MLLGAHQSVAGGLHRAFALARKDGCDTFQIFTKNASQWREPPLSDDSVRTFRSAWAEFDDEAPPLLSHCSYLINLCSDDRTIRERSRAALVAEVERCHALGVSCVVLHPGAHRGAGVARGTSMVARGLRWALDRTSDSNVAILLENTAGQGTCLGGSFSELGEIFGKIAAKSSSRQLRRMGVCVDTCHAFAAGYDLRTVEGFDRAWADLDASVGLTRIRALHLNDTSQQLGSRRDRHRRLGEGILGDYPFWRLLRDPDLASTPAVLETPPIGEDRAFREQLLRLRRMALDRGCVERDR